jgi:hypothetical protein
MRRLLVTEAEPILAALGGVQRLAWGRRLMRSSYLRVVTLYIHPFLELTLLREDQALFGIFHTTKSCYLPFTPLQSTHAQSGRVETVRPVHYSKHFLISDALLPPVTNEEPAFCIQKKRVRTRWGKIPITAIGQDRAERRAQVAVPLYSVPATRTPSAARTCTDSASSPAPAGRLPSASQPPLCPASAVRASSAPVAAAMAAAMMALAVAARAAAARAATARAAARTPTAARAPTTSRAPSSACCPMCKDFVS